MEDFNVTTQLIGKQLCKTLGEKVIIEAIDIAIQSGEVVALIGPSGCGKTTLLRCLSLLSPPDGGLLKIGEHTFECSKSIQPPWGSIYPELTTVFQQFALWPHLNVQQNLSLPLELQGLHERKNKIQGLCEELGLIAYLNRYPSQLSVGQRQRVALVRALLLKPKYLLLDEITSAQDVEHIQRIMTLIKRVANEGNCVLLATHLIGFAHHIASRFYFIDHGHIIEEGSTDALKAPKSKRLKDFLLIGDKL
ncbi:MAG: peptide ABC transporter ATP-binding protein [Candidatus Methylumidiphilus alinenensis]|uniref:Peptide ABC transporter ATP-binding protein n=1 Tax=Candidatus Methylumidiphilus alinenensis TaxID=2202197 RepID=A0A2W4QYM6_9GAMM|nr:MAG: peptide ABC transporter ATP-binding protein [Candidatus Methylumidiphilus alinenensis]